MLSMETDFLMELGLGVGIGLAFIILLMMGELATWETCQSGLICHINAVKAFFGYLCVN